MVQTQKQIPQEETWKRHKENSYNEVGVVLEFVFWNEAFWNLFAFFMLPKCRPIRSRPECSQAGTMDILFYFLLSSKYLVFEQTLESQCHK